MKKGTDVSLSYMYMQKTKLIPIILMAVAISFRTTGIGAVDIHSHNVLPTFVEYLEL